MYRRLYDWACGGYPPPSLIERREGGSCAAPKKITNRPSRTWLVRFRVLFGPARSDHQNPAPPPRIAQFATRTSACASENNLILRRGDFGRSSFKSSDHRGLAGARGTTCGDAPMRRFPYAMPIFACLLPPSFCIEHQQLSDPTGPLGGRATFEGAALSAVGHRTSARLDEHESHWC